MGGRPVEPASLGERSGIVRRYKGKIWAGAAQTKQDFYNYLRGLGSVEALLKAGIFGGIRSAFEAGIGGRKMERAISRGSVAWIAFYAGLDSRKGARS